MYKRKDASDEFAVAVKVKFKIFTPLSKSEKLTESWNWHWSQANECTERVNYWSKFAVRYVFYKI